MKGAGNLIPVYTIKTVKLKKKTLNQNNNSSPNIVTFPYRKAYILDNKLEFSGIKLAES